MANTVTRTLSKPYLIRVDKAVTLPDEVLDLLHWAVSDPLQMELDLSNNTLKLTKVTNGAAAEAAS